MAENLVLLVEMATKHFGRLVHCMLNLDGNATSCLRFLHDILCLVIDFQGRTGTPTVSSRTDFKKLRALHFAEVNDRLGACRGIGLHNRQRSPNAEGAIENVHTEDDWVTFTEGGDDLESTRPDGRGSSVFTLSLHDLLVVRLEGIEEVVNDISCR
jgi:hypothetical protein